MRKIYQIVFFMLISVNAFADPAKLLFAEINKNKLQVIEMEIDGSNKTVIYENNDVGKSGPFPIAFKDELLLFQPGISFIYDLKKKEITKLDCNENCYVIGFFKSKPYIVLETGPSMENSQVVIYDYIAFISDPEFIKTKDFSFRQIKNYAIYAYDIKSRTCKQIYKCKQGGLKFIDE